MGVSNPLIIVPMILIIFSGVFAQMVGDDMYLLGGIGGSAVLDADGAGSYNGTDYDFAVSGETIFIDDGIGLFVVIFAVVALGAVVGFGVFGIGESEVSVRAIMVSSGYFGVFILFSVLASGLFGTVPYLGLPLYIFLTIVLSLGVLGEMGN